MIRHDSWSWECLLYLCTLKTWFKAILKNQKLSSWFCRLLFFQTLPPEAQLNHETYLAWPRAFWRKMLVIFMFFMFSSCVRLPSMAGSPAHVCVFLLAFLAFVLLFACAGLAGSRFRQGCVSVWVGGFGGPFLFANACGVSILQVRGSYFTGRGSYFTGRGCYFTGRGIYFTGQGLLFYR